MSLIGCAMKVRTTISIEGKVLKEFQKLCIDLNVTVSSEIERLLKEVVTGMKK